MFDLFLPLVLGMVIGIETETPVAPVETVEVEAAQTAPETGSGDDAGSGDEVASVRTPEPQNPTGQFTTAVEVRPILGMTKINWVGVREYDGQDLVYFTHLLAWRCGLWDIRYGINGAPAQTGLGMEPCNEDMAQPNAMLDVETYLPYVAFPLQSVESIYIEITFDDGTTDFAQFDRSEVRIP